MQIKTLSHTVAELNEAVAKTLAAQVAAEDIIILIADFSDSTSFTISEGRSNGYYARYFKSI